MRWGIRAGIPSKTPGATMKVPDWISCRMVGWALSVISRSSGFSLGGTDALAPTEPWQRRISPRNRRNEEPASDRLRVSRKTVGVRIIPTCSRSGGAPAGHPDPPISYVPGLFSSVVPRRADQGTSLYCYDCKTPRMRLSTHRRAGGGCSDYGVLAASFLARFLLKSGDWTGAAATMEECYWCLNRCCAYRSRALWRASWPARTLRRRGAVP